MSTQRNLFPFLECPVCNRITQWTVAFRDMETGYECTHCKQWRSVLVFDKLYKQRIEKLKIKRHVS